MRMRGVDDERGGNDGETHLYTLGAVIVEIDVEVCKIFGV